MSAALPPLLLLLGAVASSRQATRLEVRVTAAPDHAGGQPEVEDAGLTGALAQALVDAGLPATRTRAADVPCGDGCLRVLVHRTDAQRFVVEVSATGQTARARLQLAASASAFDLAHALAIQVEVLADRTRASGPRRARAALASAVATPPAPDAAPGGEPPAGKVDAVPGPTAAPARAPARANATPASVPIDGPPAVRAAPAPVAAPRAQDARLAFDVAALVLAAPDGDLFMHGPSLGARVRVGGSGEIRGGIAFLHPQRRSLTNSSYQRELLPLQLVVAGPIPRLPAVHVGMGLETVLVSVETAGDERPGHWSLGAIGRVEYRYAIRGFALLAAAQAALHPTQWRIGPRVPLPFADMPPWTVGAALGLEFTVF